MVSCLLHGVNVFDKAAPPPPPQAANGTDFKGQTYVSTDATQYPPSSRVYLNAHGVRINVVQAGAVGVFDAMVRWQKALLETSATILCAAPPKTHPSRPSFPSQTTIVQLTAALGLLAVASLIVDFIMLNLCATRALMRQYKMRLTGDTTALPRVRHR